MLEEFLLTLLLSVLPCKVLVSSYLIYLLLINARQVNLVGCGDYIAGIDSSERNAVDFEWTGDEENTLLECLEEDDTLAAETTSEEDEDGAGGEG